MLFEHGGSKRKREREKLGSSERNIFPSLLDSRETKQKKEGLKHSWEFLWSCPAAGFEFLWEKCKKKVTIACLSVCLSVLTRKTCLDSVPKVPWKKCRLLKYIPTLHKKMIDQMRFNLKVNQFLQTTKIAILYVKSSFRLAYVCTSIVPTDRQRDRPPLCQNNTMVLKYIQPRIKLHLLW